MPPALRRKISGADEARDEMEIYVLRQLAERDQPLLAICRGIQVMNVAFGGTLVPHLKGHRYSRSEASGHPIRWTKNGKLKRALDACRAVNTTHHQAIDRVAPGFEVTARAPDGVIEALEKPDARFFCGVQFHPERLVGVAPGFRKLFREFVRACRRDR
jgi:putative glutamine amidotransferase